MMNPLKIDLTIWYKVYTWLYWASFTCVIINGILWTILHLKMYLVLLVINLLSVAICELVLRLIEKRQED